MKTPIRTDRLVLRHWRDADRAPFAAMNADPDVRRYLGDLLSREEADGFVDSVQAFWRDNGWGLWAVAVSGVAPFVGYVGLWPTDLLPGGRRVEVGWRLAREYWGRGYATEAAREALRVGFEELDLAEIVSLTAVVNRPSIAVMERLGMVRDPSEDFDHPRVDRRAHPELVRHVLFRLSRERWRQAQVSPG